MKIPGKDKVLAFLLFLTFFLTPCLGLAQPPLDRNSYFLAVFNTPEGYVTDWDIIKPDFKMCCNTWDDFPMFLRIVKQQAKNRPILIDVSVHGDDRTGLLWIDYDAFGQDMSYAASMGYVINQIERTFPKGQVKSLFLEACYSEIVMEKSLTTQNLIHYNDDSEFSYHEGGNQIEGTDTKIDFPVYGIGSSVNYNNTVFLQYFYNVKAYFYDLRQFINNEPAKPTNRERQPIIEQLWFVLANFGN